MDRLTVTKEIDVELELDSDEVKDAFQELMRQGECEFLAGHNRQIQMDAIRSVLGLNQLASVSDVIKQVIEIWT